MIKQNKNLLSFLRTISDFKLEPEYDNNRTCFKKL